MRQQRPGQIRPRNLWLWCPFVELSDKLFFKLCLFPRIGGALRLDQQSAQALLARTEAGFGASSGHSLFHDFARSSHCANYNSNPVTKKVKKINRSGPGAGRVAAT